jgi:hypothetical protein
MIALSTSTARELPMSPRILITLAIIAVISVGTGAIVFGTLVMLDAAQDDVCAIIGGGSMLVTGGLAAFVAHVAGAFRELDGDR